MASEIRTNSITSRAGLSTISLTSTGPIFAGIATFTGSIGIAGTLTYEDVTNIDSVGVITARSGIRVGANGTKRETVHLDAGDSSANYLRFTNTGTGNGTTDGFNVGINADENALLWNFENKDTIFATNNLERIRITSAGDIGINSTSPQTKLDVIASSASRTWTPGNSVVSMFERNGHTRVTLTSAASSYGEIDFGDPNDDNAGYIRYDHSDDSMSIRTATSERFRISSDGHLGINTDFTGSQLWRAGRRLEIFGGSGNVTGELHLGANRGDGQQSVGSINFFDNTQDSNHKHVALIEVDKAGSTSNKRGGDLIFYTKNDNVASPTEKFRIRSTGIIDAPTQAGFYARMQNTKSSVMGGGASYYTVPFDTDSGSICYDQHNSYDTSTGLYTVPTGGTGYYMLATAVCLSSNVYGRGGECWFVQGGNRYFFDRRFMSNAGSGTITGFYGTNIIYLSAGQSIGVQGFISGGSTDVDVQGAAASDQITWFTARKIA